MLKRPLFAGILFLVTQHLSAQVDTVFVKGDILSKLKKQNSSSPDLLNQHMPVLKPDIRFYKMPNVSKTPGYKMEMMERYGDTLANRPRYWVIPSQPQ